MKWAVCGYGDRLPGEIQRVAFILSRRTKKTRENVIKYMTSMGKGLDRGRAQGLDRGRRRGRRRWSAAVIGI